MECYAHRSQEEEEMERKVLLPVLQIKINVIQFLEIVSSEQIQTESNLMFNMFHIH